MQKVELCAFTKALLMSVLRGNKLFFFNRRQPGEFSTFVSIVAMLDLK